MVAEVRAAAGAAYQHEAGGGPGAQRSAPARPLPPALTAAAVARFRRRVYDRFRQHYRALAWRLTRDPYAILVSEVMLQQTQVERVARHYPRFLTRFPDSAALARAPLHGVLQVWSGLGYNRRALALQRAAQLVCARHAGALPADRDLLLQLPGVGQATAGALLAFAFERPVVFIETNIRRVYLHHFFPAAEAVPDGLLLPLIARTLDRRRPRQWYYALMDYGAALGRGANPNRRSAHYARQSPFAGSARQVRGWVIRTLAAQPPVPAAALRRQCPFPADRLHAVLQALTADGLVEEYAGVLRIAGAGTGGVV